MTDAEYAAQVEFYRSIGMRPPPRPVTALTPAELAAARRPAARAAAPPPAAVVRDPLGMKEALVRRLREGGVE